MKKIALLSIFVLGLLLTSGPVVGQELSGELNISGSSTVFPVMEQAALRWQDLHPDVSIDVTSIGSGGGFQALLDEQTDIAPMSRAPQANEFQAAADAGLDITNDTVQRIGLDALTIIVNNDNPVDEIDHATVQGIYNGTFTTWDAAFPDEDFSNLSSNNIFLIERDENSGTHDYFNEEFLAEQEVDSSQFGSNYGQYNAQADLNSAVEATSNAIGYSGLAYVDESVKALDYKSADQSEAITPSIEAASDSTYALARPLFLVWDASQDNNIRDEFLDYMLSPEGQYIVRSVGYVPIAEAATGYTEVEGAAFPTVSIISALSIVGLVIQLRRRN